MKPLHGIGIQTVEFDGVPRTLRELQKITGVSEQTLRARIARGVSGAALAATTPLMGRRHSPRRWSEDFRYQGLL